MESFTKSNSSDETYPTPVFLLDREQGQEKVDRMLSGKGRELLKAALHDLGDEMQDESMDLLGAVDDSRESEEKPWTGFWDKEKVDMPEGVLAEDIAQQSSLPAIFKQALIQKGGPCADLETMSLTTDVDLLSILVERMVESPDSASKYQDLGVVVVDWLIAFGELLSLARQLIFSIAKRGGDLARTVAIREACCRLSNAVQPRGPSGREALDDLASLGGDPRQREYRRRKPVPTYKHRSQISCYRLLRPLQIAFAVS